MECAWGKSVRLSRLSGRAPRLKFSVGSGAMVNVGILGTQDRKACGKESFPRLMGGAPGHLSGHTGGGDTAFRGAHTPVCTYRRTSSRCRNVCGFVENWGRLTATAPAGENRCEAHSNLLAPRLLPTRRCGRVKYRRLPVVGALILMRNGAHVGAVDSRACKLRRSEIFAVRLRPPRR